MVRAIAVTEEESRDMLHAGQEADESERGTGGTKVGLHCVRKRVALRAYVTDQEQR